MGIERASEKETEKKTRNETGNKTGIGELKVSIGTGIGKNNNISEDSFLLAKIEAKTRTEKRTGKETGTSAGLKLRSEMGTVKVSEEIKYCVSY